jgi:hypothetical protein
MLIDYTIILGCICSPSDVLITIKGFHRNNLICFNAGRFTGFRML